MESISKKLSKIFLIVVILLGVFFRVYDLANNPVHLNQDEAVNGYDAYSLIHTLRDHHGNFLPLSFEAFGDWPPPVLTYSTLPFVAILGLNETSVRLVTAFYGIGVTLLSLLLAKQLGIKGWSRVFLVTAFSLAPVLITQSRLAIPPSIVPFYTLSSVILLIQIIKDLNENKKVRLWIYVLAGISLALGFMTYPTQKIFIPMMVVIFFVVILFRNKIEKKRLLKLVLIPVVLFVLVIGHLLPFITESNRYNFRFSVVSLTTKYQGLELVARIGRRYVQYFSPQFLLLRGDLIKMQHVENYGLVTIPVTLFFYIGLLLMGLKLVRSILKKEKINQIYAFILLTTLAAPLMASMTRDNYHTLRAIHFFSLIPIVSTIGILELKEILKKELHKKILMILVVLSVIFSIFYAFSFFNYYTTTYREKNKWAYQYGVKDLIEKANTLKDKPVIIDDVSINMPYIYYLFFNKVKPTEEVFCDVNDCKNQSTRPIGWVDVKKIGNVRFSDISKEDCKANYCLDNWKYFNK